MRLRIESIRLIGAEREFLLAPGLNIIVGSIATGKTTLLRCLRGLLGSGLENFSLETRRTISNLAGQIRIGDQEYAVLRPFVTTRTAMVDVAGEAEVARLPALQATSNYPETYGNWLLRHLGLPVLDVPSAPTQADSVPTPVTINDYLMYCTLQQGEIDNSVLGHTDFSKNIKRKYVFDILYGKYNIEIAKLREDLRRVVSELRRLQDQTKTFQEFLAGTPFENQAQIEIEARSVAKSLEEVSQEAATYAEQSLHNVGSVEQRERIRTIESEIAKLESQLKAENDACDQLGRLQVQLQSQSKRLTRSIVANEVLVDFDFVICPRCGSPLDASITTDSICYLCKQPAPDSQVSKEAMIKEQDRLERQIGETRELIEMHKKTAAKIEEVLRGKGRERVHEAEELDYQTKSYVSDEASRIAEIAKHRAELRERQRTLAEFLQLFSRFNEAQKRIANLDADRGAIQAQIDSAMSSLDNVEERIRYLEKEFREILAQFKRPEFTESGITGIDRETYLPRLDGRRFDELQSQGLKVMVNVAHVLAHQLTSLKYDLKLPNILFIDGLTGNMGYEGLDQERIESIYRYLITLNEQHADQLQIIVVDNSIPSIAKPYIKAELTEDSKLIPAEVLRQVLLHNEKDEE